MSKNFHPYPLQFFPIPKKRIWGGNKLREKLNKPFFEENIGESWEISTIKDSVSVVANGEYENIDFQELINQFPEEILGQRVYKKYGKSFPLLIKFIDAKKDLSIQLHPNDDLAKQRHNSLGKEEMWYIMDAEPTSQLMFGFNNKIDKEMYLTHLKNNEIEKVLHYENVKKGDVFHIPTGRVHAIGAGILLAEIQQSSDITYRIYDYNRLDEKGKLRELHTDLALEAIDFEVPDFFHTEFKSEKNHINKLIESNYFSTKLLNLDQIMSFSDNSKNESFTIYICIEGEAEISSFGNNQKISIGNCIFIPANINEYQIVPFGIAKLLKVTAK